MGAFLRTNAKVTTIILALLMAVVAAGGFASSDGISKIAGVLGFMLFLWPVVFLVIIPVRLLARLNRKAALFGASLGRQAVAAPGKNAGQAMRQAAGESTGRRSVGTETTRRSDVAQAVPATPGAPDPIPAKETPRPATDEGTAAEAKRMAEQFVALTERSFGFRLDYSPETLGPVDLLVDKVKATGVSERDGSGMIYSIGCYVGEVLVRHAGGEWRPTTELNMQGVCSWPLVVRMPDASGVNPIGKAFKRFRNGDGDSLAYFYQATQRMPEIIERAKPQ